jgi:hypothetical protein
MQRICYSGKKIVDIHQIDNSYILQNMLKQGQHIQSMSSSPFFIADLNQTFQHDHLQGHSQTNNFLMVSCNFIIALPT